MEWFLYLIGIIWLVVGIGLALKGQKAKEILKNLFGEKIPRWVNIIPIVIGGLFMFSCGAVRPDWQWFPLLVGILAVSKGAIFLFADEDESKAVLSWWFEAPPAALKLWGIMVLVFGVSLLWAIAK